MINERCFRTKENDEPNHICYCTKPELIENYDKAVADTTRMWDCHHRLETHTSDGERRPTDITRKELIALDMYYNRPPEELIFITKEDHLSLHHKGKNYGPLSEEHKKKISEANKGKVRSDDARIKYSNAKKGKPAWNKGNKMSDEAKRKNSEAHKGKDPWNKGLKGYKIGSYKKKGLHWYNNGVIDKLFATCPDGFVPGRLHHK